MKQFKIEADTMYIGTAAEVKAAYKAIRRAACGKEHSWKTNIFPLYPDPENFPILRPERMYALYIDAEQYMSVVNAHTALSLINEGIAIAV